LPSTKDTADSATGIPANPGEKQAIFAVSVV